MLTCVYVKNGLESTSLPMLNLMQIYKFGKIQTSQTGGHQYSDTSPYKVCECSMPVGIVCATTSNEKEASLR